MDFEKAANQWGPTPGVPDPERLPAAEVSPSLPTERTRIGPSIQPLYQSYRGLPPLAGLATIAEAARPGLSVEACVARG